jgi:hypothetical protein
MQTIEQVQAAWAALDRQAQIEAWDAFTRAIDYGEAGWNEYFLVLMPMWEQGQEPDFGPAMSEDEFGFAPMDMDSFPMPVEMVGFEQHIPW